MKRSSIILLLTILITSCEKDYTVRVDYYTRGFDSGHNTSVQEFKAKNDTLAYYFGAVNYYSRLEMEKKSSSISAPWKNQYLGFTVMSDQGVDISVRLPEHVMDSISQKASLRMQELF